jgi:hypothetical protein
LVTFALVPGTVRHVVVVGAVGVVGVVGVVVGAGVLVVPVPPLCADAVLVTPSVRHAATAATSERRPAE